MPWSEWRDLGRPPGGLLNPIVASNDDGRLEVFAWGAEGVWHRWQEAPNSAWTESWQRLGDKTGLGPLAVGRNANGRLEVFGVDDGRADDLWHAWQVVRNGRWEEWHSLSSPSIGSIPGGLGYQLAAGSNGDGRLEVFGRSKSGHLHHIWQTNPNNGWSKWHPLAELPLPEGGSQPAGFPKLAANQDGRLEVFTVGQDEGLWHQWQLASGGWSDWQSLGAPPQSFRHPLNDFVVSQSANRRLEVFVVHGESVWNKWQKNPNQAWIEEWAAIPKPRGGPRSFLGPIIVGLNKSRSLEVFARGGDGRVISSGSHPLWRTHQKQPNGPWAEWKEFGFPPGVKYLESGVAANNEDGRLEIFVLGGPRQTGSGTQTLWHRWET